MEHHRFHTMRSATAALLVAAACISPQAFAFNVYTVGGDASCGYAFIQDAIDAAAANPGEDYVFIAENRTYADQHLVITDQDVDIIGGFTDCSDFDPGLDQTTIGGTSGHSVFEIEGSSHVYLSNLVVTGAVMDDSHSGGGIYFGGVGALTLNATWVFANQAGYGGGIDVSPSGPTALTLIGSVVSANTALVSGGGIRVEGPTTLTVTHSPSQYDNYISQNTALGQGADGYGGGIEVLGPAVANFSSVLALNVAPNGGGIAAIATDRGPATVNVYTTDANSPVSIYGNHAVQYGGGVFVEPHADSGNGTLLCMSDFALDANIASNGSALFMWADGAFGAYAYFNSPGPCTPPPDAVGCAAGQPCNEVDDNVAQLSDGSPSTGATFFVMNDSALTANRFNARRNQGGQLIEFSAFAGNTQQGNHVQLHDCVLANNVVSDHLISGDGSSGGSQLIVDTCTVTDNELSALGEAVINADINFIEVTNSIVYQPDHEVLQYQGPSGDLTSYYVLTNSAVTLNGGDTIVVAAPAFVDAANGDYHLVRTSPGVDMAADLGGIDLDGNPRTVDLVDVANGWGAMDVGAYEIQTQPVLSCGASDTIFCDGFDG